jgi:hypothetical protein
MRWCGSLKARPVFTGSVQRCSRPLVLECLEDRLVPSISDGTVLVCTGPSPYSSQDQSSFPIGIIGVNPSTGTQFPVSIDSPQDGSLFTLPSYVTEAPDGQLYVTDLQAFGTGAIIRVDPNTGQQSLVTKGQLIDGPNALAWVNGYLYVANEADGSGTVHTVVQVDPNTGAQTLISDGSNGGFTVPTGMEPGSSDNVYVSDEPGGANGAEPGGVWQVDLATGNQTAITWGNLINHPVDVAQDENGNLLVINVVANLQTQLSKVIRVYPADADPVNGTNQSLVYQETAPYPLDGVTEDQNSGMIYTGSISYTTTPAELFAVNPTTQTQTVVTTGGQLSQIEGMDVYHPVEQVTAASSTTAVSSSANPQSVGQAVTWTATVADTGEVNFVNFETGDLSQTAGYNGEAIVTSSALNGAYSLQLQRSNSVANVEIRQSGATYFNLPTVYDSFLFEYSSNPGDSSIANFNDTASNEKAGLHLNGQYLRFGTTAGWLGQGTTALQPNQVYLISVEVGTGSAAPWQVLVNGNVEISGTGNLGSGNNGELELGGNDAYTCTYSYDDVQIGSQGYLGPIPTGTVQFAVDGNSIGGPVTLSDGMATSPAVSTLSAGTHVIIAAYSGDGYYTSSSSTFSQSIDSSATQGLVNYVDFETGDFSQCASHVGGAIVTSPALDGTYSLQLLRSNSVANGEIRAGGTTYYNLPTVYYSFLFEFAFNPGDGSIVNFQDTASRYKAAIHLSPSDHLEFYNQAGTLLATGTTTLQPNTVYTISAMIGTGSNASWQVQLNGNVELSGTGNLGTTSTVRGHSSRQLAGRLS